MTNANRNIVSSAILGLITDGMDDWTAAQIKRLARAARVNEDVLGGDASLGRLYASAMDFAMSGIGAK